MSLDLEVLGSKIRRYKEQLQLSIAELSHATGVDKDRLAQFEAGAQEPTGAEILILADFFRCDYLANVILESRRTGHRSFDESLFFQAAFA